MHKTLDFNYMEETYKSYKTQDILNWICAYDATHLSV